MQSRPDHTTTNPAEVEPAGGYALAYHRIDPQEPPPPAGRSFLLIAIGLCLPLLVLAACMGISETRPDLIHPFAILGPVMMVGTPLFLACGCVWLIGIVQLSMTRRGWEGRFRWGILLALAPPLLGMVALILTTGFYAPPPTNYAARSVTEQPVAWEDAANEIRVAAEPGRAPDRILGIKVESVSLDEAGGVWFQTRTMDAEGFIWDYWHSGIVHQPGPGLDPIGNRNQLTLEPLGNGWYAFRTRWSD